MIPNGVVFSELPVQTDKIRELGLEPGRYVLTVGRLVPEKRQLDLLHAFRDMKGQGFKLAIVGRIDHQNGYADRLASEAKDQPDVVMTGYQSGETLRQLYAHAALFVLPSSHEGLPIVLLEALSYGLSVLVSDIPSNREVVSDDARIFEVGNCKELGAKLAALTSAPIAATEREAVRRENIRRYDWNDIATRTSDVYSSALDRPWSVGRAVSAAKGPDDRFTQPLRPTQMPRPVLVKSDMTIVGAQSDLRSQS